MPFNLKDFDLLVDRLFKVIEDTNKQITKEALNWHREHCVNLGMDEKCEDDFMKAFFLSLDIKAARLTREITVLQVNTEPVDPRLN